MTGSLASYTCPVCNRTSYNPTDAAEGYCGACHEWTRHCTCEWEPNDRTLSIPNIDWQLVAVDRDCPVHGWGG